MKKVIKTIKEKKPTGKVVETLIITEKTVEAPELLARREVKRNQG